MIPKCVWPSRSIRSRIASRASSIVVASATFGRSSSRAAVPVGAVEVGVEVLLADRLPDEVERLQVQAGLLLGEHGLLRPGRDGRLGLGLDGLLLRDRRRAEDREQGQARRTDGATDSNASSVFVSRDQG